MGIVSPPPGPPFPERRPQLPLADAAGLPAADVERIYRDEGFRVRILAPDSVITLEYRPDRINLVVEDGIVVRASQG